MYKLDVLFLIPFSLLQLFLLAAFFPHGRQFWFQHFITCVSITYIRRSSAWRFTGVKIQPLFFGSERGRVND
jgi:hypothetical protein